MQTKVHIPDRHFLVISGMIHDTLIHEKSGIPCLGGLPIVGAAFSNNLTTKEKDNVIMFIRPHILTTSETYKEITERQEDLYRSQTREEAFDQAIDLVSTPDDE